MQDRFESWPFPNGLSSRTLFHIFLRNQKSRYHMTALFQYNVLFIEITFLMLGFKLTVHVIAACNCVRVIYATRSFAITLSFPALTFDFPSTRKARGFRNPRVINLMQFPFLGSFPDFPGNLNQKSFPGNFFDIIEFRTWKCMFFDNSM